MILLALNDAYLTKTSGTCLISLNSQYNGAMTIKY